MFRQTLPTVALLLCAVLIKTGTHALLMGPAAALVWITPGNSLGLGVGLALWFTATFLNFPLPRAVAGMPCSRAYRTKSHTIRK